MRQAFADFWAKLVAGTWQLRYERSRMSITVGEFRRILEQAYDAGQFDANADPASSLFGKLFGNMN